MTEPQQPTVRDIINKYSPIVQGRTGLLGFAFKAVARPIEFAWDTLHNVEQLIMPSGFTNAAGQAIIGTAPVVVETFGHMESRLRKSFNAATTPAARDAFLSLADEVKRDAAVLSASANVVNNELNLAPESYRFVLLKGEDGAAHTTLEQGIAEITQQQERKNPVTVRRNPNPYGQPRPGVTATAQ